jgi:DNA invertase Pin-like site-specific DNA recombinase
MRKIAIYARVSTDEQTVDNQLRDLREVAARNGWEIVHEYIDKGISGAKGRDKRPQFDKLIKDAISRRFDLIACWSVDRLGRSLRDLVDFLAEIHAKKVGLYLHQQGIDTSTPGGKALFQMAGVFAEFERSMIVERTKAGLQRARAQGKQLGRPQVPPTVVKAVETLRASGMGMLAIARQLGIGTGTVQRIVRS